MADVARLIHMSARPVATSGKPAGIDTFWQFPTKTGTLMVLSMVNFQDQATFGEDSVPMGAILIRGVAAYSFVEIGNNNLPLYAFYTLSGLTKPIAHAIVRAVQRKWPSFAFDFQYGPTG